jgi:regulator of sigma E protease
MYSLNTIPFGGFVKIFGENGLEEGVGDKSRNFSAKPKWVQAIVLAAGVTCNIILAWVLLSIGLMVGLPASTDLLSANDHVTSTQLVIAGVAPQTPAALAGLKAGDEVLSLRVGAATTDAITTPSAGEMQDFVARHGTKAIALEYKRGGEVQVVQVTPEMGSNQTPAIGVNLAEVGLIKLSPPQALWFGAKLTGRLTVLTVTTFANFIYTTIVGTGSLSDLTGPVGLVSLVGDAANLGWVYLLTFTALISVNLAVINLLPIPALDGGRLLFLLIEAIKRSPIKPRSTQIANTIGAVALLLLMAIVTYHDIARLLHLG